MKVRLFVVFDITQVLWVIIYYKG